MNHRETAQLLAVVALEWPHSRLGDNAEVILNHWQRRLSAVTAADAAAAIEELAAGGREYAPPPSIVLAKIAERAQDAPEWDEAREEIRAALRRYRPPRDVAQRNPYAAPPADYWSHPAVAAFAEHAWDEWRMAPDPETDGLRGTASTFYAQQRDAYQALRRRTIRDHGLRVVGAPRKPGLQRLDPLAHLPRPDGA